jgi:hypothetical protein
MISYKEFLTEGKEPRWKRAGPDGEKVIEFPKAKRKFMVEKQYDENIRHRGEWKVMEWDPRTKEWEWQDTFSPQWYAKEQVMEMGKWDRKGNKVGY